MNQQAANPPPAAAGAEQMEPDHEELVARLGALAREALPLWGLPPDAEPVLINLSENATYRIDLPGAAPVILRIHREGYHSETAIRSELAWAAAIREESGIITPKVIPGRDGEAIQNLAGGGLPRPRRMVLFEFIDGEEPEETHNLLAPFVNLGETTALLHLHALQWQRPPWFERLIWDFDHLAGRTPNWGDWRAAPGMEPKAQAILERQEAAIARRLAAFGQGPDRYNLVHADLRLANLLIKDGSTRVIDFDDCGFGWLLYDFATAVSFFEHEPQVPELAAAWVEGYRRHRPLPAADEAEIPTFVVLRRMALLAWTGSHSETDLAKEMGPAYTLSACDLAERYLAAFG